MQNPLEKQIRERGIPFGKYQLVAKLAIGGMAELFLAKQEGPGGFSKTVAVKCILPHYAQNNEFISMFMDEARVASRLNHPNVVQILEVGDVDGIYYMAMEYIPGQNLKAFNKRLYSDRYYVENPPFELIAQLFAQAASGLDHVHNAMDDRQRLLNLVHRDISPNNLMLSYNGVLKVVDFGVAKARSQENETEVGTLKGRLSYMSPEYLSAQPIDGRSDLFALGIVLYEITTNKRLFRQRNEAETIQALLTWPIPRPSQICSAYPPMLEEIVMTALERNPANRYQSAEEMQRALEDFIEARQKFCGSRQVADLMEKIFPQEKEHNRKGIYASPVTPGDLINLSRGSYRVMQPATNYPYGSFSQSKDAFAIAQQTARTPQQLLNASLGPNPYQSPFNDSQGSRPIPRAHTPSPMPSYDNIHASGTSELGSFGDGNLVSDLDEVTEISMSVEDLAEAQGTSPNYIHHSTSHDSLNDLTSPRGLPGSQGGPETGSYSSHDHPSTNSYASHSHPSTGSYSNHRASSSPSHQGLSAGQAGMPQGSSHTLDSSGAGLPSMPPQIGGPATSREATLEVAHPVAPPEEAPPEVEEPATPEEAVQTEEAAQTKEAAQPEEKAQPLPQPPPPVQIEKQKKSSVFPILLILSLLLAGGAAGAYFLYFKKESISPLQKQKTLIVNLMKRHKYFKASIELDAFKAMQGASKHQDWIDAQQKELKVGLEIAMTQKLYHQGKFEESKKAYQALLEKHNKAELMERYPPLKLLSGLLEQLDKIKPGERPNPQIANIGKDIQISPAKTRPDTRKKVRARKRPIKRRRRIVRRRKRKPLPFAPKGLGKKVKLNIYDNSSGRRKFTRALPRLCKKIEREANRLLGYSYPVRGVTKPWQNYVKKRFARSRKKRFVFYPRAAAYVIYRDFKKGRKKARVGQTLINYQKRYRFKKYSDR